MGLETQIRRADSNRSEGVALLLFRASDVVRRRHTALSMQDAGCGNGPDTLASGIAFDCSVGQAALLVQPVPALNRQTGD